MFGGSAAELGWDFLLALWVSVHVAWGFRTARLVVPNGFVGCFGTESINAKDKLSEMAPRQELFKTPALQLTNAQVECRDLIRCFLPTVL